jgi:hypothetical protein
LNDDGWFDFVAMSKKPGRKTYVAGDIYYRDKSGALNISGGAMQRLAGIVGALEYDDG